MERSIQAVKRRFGIIGHSPALDNALNTAIRVAETELSVLITGESGVGKEVFSKMIHELSARKHKKFIAINTGAIPEGTINSELFGHESGAFTGANTERKGYFETVDGGTIFLDEIGEMPLDTQSFLLRVLESGEYLRVGSSVVRETNVRIIAATNVSLIDAIKKGKFREDLYYRLSTVPIIVPPLRERGKDVLTLFRKFAQDFAEKYGTSPVRITEEAEKIVMAYNWPGNIRELRNFVEQVSVMSDRKIIDPEDLEQFMPSSGRQLPIPLENKHQDSSAFHEREILYKFLYDMKSDLSELRNLVFELISNNHLSVQNKDRIRKLTSESSVGLEYEGAGNISLVDTESQGAYSGSSEQNQGSPIILKPEEIDQYRETEIVDEDLSLEEMEKVMIRKALKKHSGKRKDAAEDLGISERTLYRKIKQYNLKGL